MSGMRRTLIEIVTLLVLGLVVFGAWKFFQGKHTQQLQAELDSHRAELAAVREKAEFWANSLAQSEADAALRAFVAGIAPSVLGGRRDSVDLALNGLLELDGIDFVHVLQPDGEVISSSDRKILSAGNVGERGAWALSTEAVTVRQDKPRSVTELATPIPGPDGPVAFVWLGYRADEVKEEARPETLKPLGG